MKFLFLFGEGQRFLRHFRKDDSEKPNKISLKDNMGSITLF